MPANFFPSTTTEIDKRLQTAFDSLGGTLFPDHRIPGTPGYNLRQLFLRMLQTHYSQMNVALDAMSPRTATGLTLDGWAGFFGMPRKGPAAASGQVQITSTVTGQALARIAGTRLVKAGTRMTVGNVALSTAADVEIPLNGRTATVSVTTVRTSDPIVITAGQTLDIVGGSLSSYLTAITTTDVRGGTQGETDAQLRYRLVKSLINPSTTDGYLTRLLAHTDVSQAEVEGGVYGPGTLEAFVTPAIAFPPTTLRTELERLYTGPGRAYVLFPDYEALVLKVRVAGDVDPATIANWINNLPIGSTLILNALETLVQNSGAGDAQVIGVKRGPVLDDGNYADLITLNQITNLTPTSARSKWYTQTSWITICS